MAVKNEDTAIICDQKFKSLKDFQKFIKDFYNTECYSGYAEEIALDESRYDYFIYLDTTIDFFPSVYGGSPEEIRYLDKGKKIIRMSEHDKYFYGNLGGL